MFCFEREPAAVLPASLYNFSSHLNGAYQLSREEYLPVHSDVVLKKILCVKDKLQTHFLDSQKNLKQKKLEASKKGLTLFGLYPPNRIIYFSPYLLLH